MGCEPKLGYSRQQEAGQKDRKDKRRGDSKKPSGFQDAAVPIIHFHRLRSFGDPQANGPSTRSFRKSDYGPSLVRLKSWP